MHYIFITLICLILSINLVLTRLINKKTQGRLTKVLTSLAFVGFIFDFVIITTLISKSRSVIFVAFTLYYIAFSWFLVLLLHFAIIYTTHSYIRFFKNPAIYVATVQSVILLINLKSKFLFSITHTEWLNHSFWVARHFKYFSIFSGVCLFETIVFLTLMLRAAISVAPIYRSKYLMVGGGMLIGTIIYAIIFLKNIPFVTGVLVINTGVAIIIYTAIFHAQKQLMHSAMHFLSDKLNDGIVLYDDEHILQFVTDSFLKSFNITNKDDLLNEQKFFSVAMTTINSDSNWVDSLKCIERDGKNHYYEIRHMELSEKDKPVGTVYWIINVTETVANYNRMQHLAHFDELTDIYNERHFYEMVKNLLDNNPDTPYVLLLSDISKFKVFTERFGEDATNEMLYTSAQSIKQGLQHLGSSVVYGRIDTDIFAIVMPRASFSEDDFLKCIDSLVEKYSTENYELKLLLGVYDIIDPQLPVSTMCNRARIASASISKNYGKRLAWFDENIQRTLLREERYNAELSSAIKSGQIKMYLQAQVDANGVLKGAEALVRWIHPEDGLIPPIRFIPNFEQNGRITELDLCIWRQACEKLREWKAMGRDDLHISVNISAKDLYALNIYEVYTSLIEEYDINPKQLKLEITESAIIDDLHQHIALINRLHEAGFEVEMDDFGSAYSSFNMLKDICVDVLKIDMNFLGNTENTERSEIILKSIVSLSRNLNMHTVAEGVETQEQLDFLREAGCDIYQGYYFAKPLPVEEFEIKFGIK